MARAALPVLTRGTRALFLLAHADPVTLTKVVEIAEGAALAARAALKR